MIEIRIHGRGGQGAVVASQILARAAFLSGHHVQVFPQFGVERRGAPVVAFARISDRPIRLRTHVYNPDHIVVLDAALIDCVDVTTGLAKSGRIVVNFPGKPEELALSSRFAVDTVDATAIASGYGIGTTTSPIVNTAMVGALARATELVPLDKVLQAIRETVGSAADANCAAASDAYQNLVAGVVPSSPAPASQAPAAQQLFRSPEDLPLTAQSLDTTLGNQTGSWKYLEPYYEDRTPPCVGRCRLSNDLVTLMRLVETGDMERAARLLLESNPMPAVLGRVCPHPCEQPCNRKAFGGGIQIRAVERAVGDYALEHDVALELAPMDKGSVGVVGSGPGGLSAAYFLRRLGHRVTVYEKERNLGGLLWSGIPPYRLPREVLAAELKRFESLGIEFKTGVVLGDQLSIDKLCERHEAVVLAVGLAHSRGLGIPGEGHPAVFDGDEFLRQVHLDRAPEVTDPVAVVGGGNTAIDCARTLIRLGCRVKVIYRRGRREMPAFKDEVNEAVEEGVEFEFLTQPVGLVTKSDGALEALVCQRMELGQKDLSGRRRPVPVADSEFTVAAGAVVKALGTSVEPSIFELLGTPEHGSSIAVDPGYATTRPGVYAVGDCAGGEGTVADAIRSGREVAYLLHGRLTGAQVTESDPVKLRGASPTVAKFKDFNPAYFQANPAPRLDTRPALLRVGDFEEVTTGLDAESVRFEAERCFKCGTCTQCDNCRVYCPDGAICWDPETMSYRILEQYCKGCGVCAEECPRGAIHLRRIQAAKV